MTSRLKPQVHIEPYRENDMHGMVSEYIEMHTYNPDDIHSLALISIRGWNGNSERSSVELWITADQVKAIRDGLDQLIETDSKSLEVPKDTCEHCRGMGSDPQYGNDVPCYSCGGSGKVKL